MVQLFKDRKIMADKKYWINYMPIQKQRTILLEVVF